MAADFFLKLDKITGESTDSEHKQEIELKSWSWGESQTGTMGSSGGGGGAGKVNMQDFHFTMELSAASTALAKACADGTHIATGVLTARKAGGKQQKYLVVTMNDLLISSYQTGGSESGGIPIEQVSLNFSKIKMEYFKQDEKGNTSAAGNMIYDLKSNKAS